MEGKVADDDVGLVRERVVEDVTVDEVDVGADPPAEVLDATTVDLDGRERPSEVLEGEGERAGPGTDLEKGAVRVPDEVEDTGDDAPVDEVVLDVGVRAWVDPARLDSGAAESVLVGSAARGDGAGRRPWRWYPCASR